MYDCLLRLFSNGVKFNNSRYFTKLVQEVLQIFNLPQIFFRQKMPTHEKTNSKTKLGKKPVCVRIDFRSITESKLQKIAGNTIHVKI